MPQQIRLLLNRSPSAVRLAPSGSARPAPAASAPQAASAQQAAAEEAARLEQQLEFLRQLLNEVGVAIEELQQQHRNTLTEMQQTTVELAVIAASWIVGAAIDADMFAVDDLVASMIQQLHKAESIRVYLNPDDANLLEHLRHSSDAISFARADVEFIPDAQLSRGIVRAESPRSALVTNMDDRLAEIRRIWMENLNETQTERRADEPAGGKFRRFPERRHTA
ncbi:MAG: FliH/SctL family protein [Fuerstiella sp.]